MTEKHPGRLKRFSSSPKQTDVTIVSEANGWDSITKARQLATSLKAKAADVLRTIPEDQ